ncbi:hypothetical protein AUC43_15260 [Hymenobacter sedentarius]|uniref:Homeodomain phBC6A51-type domain-containing protein n=1 Tax=Hymenobacter sedentarius TaxID=1411621 RepID=A0A0U4C176_9BACT|nr:hypothetical protein [Hymenobacter sedentarius]ALW86321.1 hypothetical protein AUC43_15260 [Hymenobacter sedentarius]
MDAFEDLYNQAPKPKHAGGRPTLYTPELARQICDLVAEGNSLRKICQDDDLPSRRTILNWMTTYPEFLRQYEAAYKVQMLVIFDELKDIVDECDVVEIAKVREQLKLRQWLLKIQEPKKFGERPEPREAESAHELDLSQFTDEEYATYKKLIAAATPPKKDPNE